MRIRDKSMGDRKAGKFSKLNQLPLELGIKHIYIRQLQVQYYLKKFS